MKAMTMTLILALLAGCATSQGYGSGYRPIVDRPGPNYAVDLSECQAYADQVMSASEGAVAGAVAGALFGALVMAAVGGSSHDGAWVGALSGGSKAAADAEGGQRGIITRCLTGRGYNVLQ